MGRFYSAVITRLQSIRSPSEYLQSRLAILAAGGLNPSRLNRELRTFKAAWEGYLTAAFAIGLLDGTHGRDLRARLTGDDDNSFLSAMSECFAAWYLAGRRRLIPRPVGQQRHCLEFLIERPDGNINVEVKAPPARSLSNFFGAMTAIGLSGRFKKRTNSSPRVSEICSWSTRACVCRSSPNLTGHQSSARLSAKKSSVYRSIRQPAAPAGPACAAFNQNGRLLKRWPEPRYTRISAALFLNEYEEGGEVKPRALMIYNPNAETPLPREIWQGIPEFFLEGDRWRWSDDGTAAA